MSDAKRLNERLAERFAEVDLTINESKFKVVYIDTFERRDVEIRSTFLGYEFKVHQIGYKWVY